MSYRMNPRDRMVRVACRIGKMGKFKTIHNCGSITRSNPVNLLCQTTDGVRFYVAQGLGGDPDTWSVDYTYNPECDVRVEMNSINGIPTQRDMIAIVEKILHGDYRAVDKTLPA